jgi:hypothetical protein
VLLPLLPPAPNRLLRRWLPGALLQLGQRSACCRLLWLALWRMLLLHPAVAPPLQPRGLLLLLPGPGDGSSSSWLLLWLACSRPSGGGNRASWLPAIIAAAAAGEALNAPGLLPPSLGPPLCSSGDPSSDCVLLVGAER